MKWVTLFVVVVTPEVSVTITTFAAAVVSSQDGREMVVERPSRGMDSWGAGKAAA